ncbi:MAG: Uncharacterized protein XD69_0748 [Clostridia bacterium 62_21]|nr:MAG: Uncharacterized protein XD69_0748 [Clostridia bacterium 62_21]HAG06549.1 hypothetical protein [Peptococcaceae bacterium]
MRCDFCGTVFTEAEARPACTGCPLAGVCKKRKCPRCGYEVLPEPKWVKALKAWGGSIFAGYKANR